MTRPRECVIDTGVLQKANAPLQNEPRARAQIRDRLELLSRIRDGQIVVLFSDRLIDEYRDQIREPRNEVITWFLSYVANPRNGRVIPNWAPWTGALPEAFRRCRFPKHDRHVLRTAFRRYPTFIVCEDGRMLWTDECIHRRIRIHVWTPQRILST